MCDFLSAWVLENGDVLCDPEHSDSHDELAIHFGIKDGIAQQGRAARVEFTPPEDLKTIGDPTAWRLRLDEVIAPDWWTDAAQVSAAERLREIVRRMIVTDERRLLLGGCWIAIDKAIIEAAKNCRLVGIYGGTVERIVGGTVKCIDGGTVKCIVGGTVKCIVGGTVECIVGGTVKRIDGGTVKCIVGDTVERIVGGTVERIVGGTVKRIDGGTVERIVGGTVKCIYGGTVKCIDGGTVERIVGGTVKRIDGGTVERIVGDPLIGHIGPLAAIVTDNREKPATKPAPEKKRAKKSPAKPRTKKAKP
jgi:hypothetical protein